MLEQHKKNLLESGYTIIDVNDFSFLEEMKEEFLVFAQSFLGHDLKNHQLENLHHDLPFESLNEFRLKSIQLINQNEKFRKRLKEVIVPYFQAFMGPDLAVQKNINLVFSLPGDVTSQIPLHSDVWTGHSPFELNLWIPFTRTQKTQSMFIMPLEKWMRRKNELENSQLTLKELMKTWAEDFVYLEMNSNQALIFWHHLPHGNTVNQEEITRLSLNLRVKSLYTPYGDKGLGDYFVPWTYGPMSELVFKSGEQWD